MDYLQQFFLTIPEEIIILQYAKENVVLELLNKTVKNFCCNFTILYGSLLSKCNVILQHMIYSDYPFQGHIFLLHLLQT